MRRKSTPTKQETITNSGKKLETVTSKKTEYVKIRRAAEKLSQSHLEDERWDILPKTDYTYAKSGSYSPRFFGRKYVNPNMSRYRIHGKGGASGQAMELDDVDYDGYLSSEFSDDERIGQELNDSDSDVSYEKVLVNGMELRSGKNLKTLKEILNEHDEKLQQSEIIRSNNRTSYTTSKFDSMSQRDRYNVNRNAQTGSASRKAQSAKQNERQYSKSEQKRVSDSNRNVYSSRVADYSDVRARRNLNTDFSTHSNLVRHNASNSRNRAVDTKYSRFESAYDEIDGRPESKTTVTDEYSGVDGGVVEKGAVETSEKRTGSKAKDANKNGHNNIHLYGLDSEREFSDSETLSTGDARYGSSRSRSSGYTDPSRSSSTVTTVVTTITETITTVTAPIISPVWNTVGRPVWHHVGQPVKVILTSVLYLSWWLLTQPFLYLLRSAGHFMSWLWNSRPEEIVEGVAAVPEWLWHKVEYISWQLVAADAWLFRRRRGRGCCLCLPLLLLIPLLFALLAGVDMSRSRSAIFGIFSSGKSPAQNLEKHEHFVHLNDEVRMLILQLQSSSKDQLTVADVEAIVRRIVGQETDSLKASIQGSKDQDLRTQAQWNVEQTVQLEQMQSKHDALLATIKELEGTVAGLKAGMASQSEEAKTESASILAELEAKLTVLHTELHNLEAEHAALLARVNACCHNETYYQAAIKDSVNAILAEMMAGHMSGNPSQDTFTQWLHTHYVSREVLDKRLEDLATELTASVLAMVKDLQEKQSQQYKQYGVHIQANGTGLGEQQVRQMIEEALFRYSADKTGMADYALESGGGTVLSTRCSESYYRKTALVSVFGIPLWYTSNSPRTVIQPEVNPGQCWAFRGGHGYIVIQTSTIITPTGFTLEHIPKSLAPSGEIDSAPKDFTVLGLESEYDDKGVSLGNYTYQDEGTPMQYFPVQLAGSPKPFNLYELRILGNYGNQEYTCLYRFRIHGKPYKG